MILLYNKINKQNFKLLRSYWATAEYINANIPKEEYEYYEIKQVKRNQFKKLTNKKRKCR